MLIPFADVEPLLRAPGQPSVPVRASATNGRPHFAAAPPGQAVPRIFPVAAGQPVLIDFDQSVASPDWFTGIDVPASPVTRRKQWPRRLKGLLLGTAGISTRNVRRFRDSLPNGPSPLVLMIGAATRGMGTDALYEDPAIRQVAFDIYPSTLTHFVADAHQIPLADACVDAVCVQAVLEHVIDPASVVAEIERVLKPEGVVYAETPFMQQVHEGAYDFTRFTELGHRWLWRRFATIARGPLGGPGLSLYWSSRYFLRGLLRSRRAADLLSVPFGVFALADRVMTAGDLIDGASGAFFLGRKRAAALAQHGLVLEYLGSQRAAAKG
jgi:SAM-dependent methyltransferase